MNLPVVVTSVVFGLFAGWLAGIAMKAGGYGLLWDMMVGLGGGVVAAWLFQTLEAPQADWGATGIAAFAGAALMLAAQRKLWPARPTHV